MYSEDDLLPLSALQHLAFCERQWGLIHLEQQWAENRLTAEGRLLHDRVHEQASESRVDVRIVRGLRLRSLRLGLIGAADTVEFHRDGEIMPVEHKHGTPKRNNCDEVQLCAQALCIEEMLGTSVRRAALYYAKRRRRTEVDLSPELRARTEALSGRLHDLQKKSITPPPEHGPKCERCSLATICLPKPASQSASSNLERCTAAALRG
jgi:CRISPR-associated exonuclease Cas4